MNGAKTYENTSACDVIAHARNGPKSRRRLDSEAVTERQAPSLCEKWDNKTLRRMAIATSSLSALEEPSALKDAPVIDFKNRGCGFDRSYAKAIHKAHDDFKTAASDLGVTSQVLT